MMKGAPLIGRLCFFLVLFLGLPRLGTGDSLGWVAFTPRLNFLQLAQTLARLEFIQSSVEFSAGATSSANLPPDLHLLSLTSCVDIICIAQNFLRCVFVPFASTENTAPQRTWEQHNVYPTKRRHSPHFPDATIALAASGHVSRAATPGVAKGRVHRSKRRRTLRLRQP